MSEEPGRKIGFAQFKSICRAITTYEDLHTLINHIVQHTCGSFQVKACSIFLFDDRERQLFRVASCGISDSYLSKGPLPLDERTNNLAMGEPVFVRDMSTDPRVQYPDDAKREGFVSMLSVPIRYRQAFHGIIRIYHGEFWSLHEDDLDSFCLLADQLGLVVENSGLKNFLDQVKHAMGNLPLRMLEGLYNQ